MTEKIDLKEITDIIDKTCTLVARRFRIEQTDLFSYCLFYANNWYKRLDSTRPVYIQRAYIKECTRLCCLRCIEREMSIIRTPRPSKRYGDEGPLTPFKFVPLLESDQHYG